jgi:ABC-type bacteriocin/lantibiotic exporter with double-glycine peptidase domain
MSESLVVWYLRGCSVVCMSKMLDLWTTYRGFQLVKQYKNAKEYDWTLETNPFVRQLFKQRGLFTSLILNGLICALSIVVIAAVCWIYEWETLFVYTSIGLVILHTITAIINWKQTYSLITPDSEHKAEEAVAAGGDVGGNDGTK